MSNFILMQNHENGLDVPVLGDECGSMDPVAIAEKCLEVMDIGNVDPAMCEISLMQACDSGYYKMTRYEIFHSGYDNVLEAMDIFTSRCANRMLEAVL